MKSNREQNYEIKYLRKSLGQIDKRIQVPQSLDAASLRGLLDDIPDVAPRDVAKRRPFRLTLQSGIAYAAAFALIVALFYSMELYKPSIIDGGISISQSEEAPQPDVVHTDTPEAYAQPEQEAAPALAEGGSADGTIMMPEPASAPETDNSPEADSGVLYIGDNIGGGGKSVLLFEQGDRAYYGRANDASDPDRVSPATLEVVDTQSQDILMQAGIPDMQEITLCYVLEDTVLVAGKGEDGLVIRVYSGLDGDGGMVEQLSVTQPGNLADARMYKNIVHIASVSGEPAETGEVVELPNAESPDTCVITAIDLGALEAAQSSFVGAKGTVQLHNLAAYIHYEGAGEDDSIENYIGQILFEGIDMDLGTVS